MARKVLSLQASPSVCVRQVQHGWSEASPYDDGCQEALRTVFCESVMTSGVWTAVIRIVGGRDDRAGGIFVGIAPDGCSPSRPLGDRDRAAPIASMMRTAF